MSKLIRINKRIAQSGLYSRREADKLISNGLVTFNGKSVNIGTMVPINGGLLVINGSKIVDSEISVYKFHKPIKVLSSYYDPNGKRNLSSFSVFGGNRLGYSGRLDYDSEGLMIFSTDGDLIYGLQRSEFGVEKEYDVYTDKDITADWVRTLCSGIEDKNEQFLSCIVKRVAQKRYTVILTEGKKRQVRRMFKAAGANVLRLIRVRIGSVTLGDLSEGSLVPLSEKELLELRKCIK